MTHSVMGAMHLFAALASILLGAAVIFLPKGHAAHRLLGLAYSFAMLTTCTSALLLYGMTGHFGLFHFFALVCLTYVVMGVAQPILRRGDWVRRHLIWMGWSYLGLLAAAATEVFIRLPGLTHISDNQTFLLGGALGAAIAVLGWLLMPRWTRMALENMCARRG